MACRCNWFLVDSGWTVLAESIAAESVLRRETYVGTKAWEHITREDQVRFFADVTEGVTTSVRGVSGTLWAVTPYRWSEADDRFVLRVALGPCRCSPAEVAGAFLKKAGLRAS